MFVTVNTQVSIYSAIISGGPPVAKAPNENGSDGEERKLGEQTGLDIETLVLNMNFLYIHNHNKLLFVIDN